jgi:L-methionine (R)-S-oxide reductase
LRVFTVVIALTLFLAYPYGMIAPEARNYARLFSRINALCEDEDDIISKMATIACELYQSIDGFDWVGFYRVVGPEQLKIGPYQGTHGCLSIPFDRGVCGAAARLQQTQIVDDVNTFDGHIACSASTKSELVIPCFDLFGEVFAILDIDSDQPAFFSQHDARELETMLAEVFGGSVISCDVR